MKQFVFVLFCLCCFCKGGFAEATTSFKVLQLNLWNGTDNVSGGYKGLIETLNEADADVVLLCEIKDGQMLLTRIIADLKEKGKNYYGNTCGLSIGLLSKWKPERIEKCCIVPGHEDRAMVKLLTTVDGHPLAFYSCHLDYTHYECYLPRGYSGTTWKKIDKPITDEEEVLARNRESFREESIAAFIREAQADIDAGRAVVMGGDFNEPSHRDWQADTKALWDHNGAVIRWDCSVLLEEAGYKDVYRERYPDAVHYPGFTFPTGNRAAELSKLTWAPDVDERDRIDFVYYHAGNASLSVSDCKLIGPSETILRGEIAENESSDPIWTPSGTWPSDHKGNLVTFMF